MKTNLLIIDGDALTYMSSKDTIEESISVINDKIHNIFKKTGGTHYVMFISNTPYFRHSIDPAYKSNRANNPSSLKWLKTLKKYLIEGYGAHSMRNIEADDLVAYFMNQDICVDGDNKMFQTRDTFESALQFCRQDKLPEFKFTSVKKTLCAVDKDLVKSIPGKHFNFTYKLLDKTNPNSVIKGWWTETDSKDANKFIWEQMITGDASDGISGLSGKGEVYYKKITDNLADEEIPFLIEREYILHHKDISKGIYEYQKNYRLLHLLNCEEDFFREVKVLPEFISPIKINIQEVIEIGF